MATLPSLAPLTPPVYFLSDAHLGAVLIPDPRTQVERLDRLFGLVQTNAKSLVLAGDLFDFWYEWKWVVPKKYFHVLHRLRDFVDSGISVHYLAGNHDFRLSGFLEGEVGLDVHQDWLSAEIGGQPTFIFHGDGVLPRDHGYRVLKKVLRNRAAQRVFSWIHPDLAMNIARGTSVTSKAITRINEKDDAEYLKYAQARFAEGYQCVVVGHTHRPIEHREDGHTYVNLGDWIKHYTYAVHDGHQLSLQHFNP